MDMMIIQWMDWGARFSDWDETIPQRNGLPIQSLYNRVTHSEWDERFLLCCLVGGKDRILRILGEPPWFIHGLSILFPMLFWHNFLGVFHHVISIIMDHSAGSLGP